MRKSIAQLEKELRETQELLAQLISADMPTPAPVEVELTPDQQRIAELEAQLKAATEKPAPVEVELTPDQQRIAELEAQLKAATEKPAETKKEESALHWLWRMFLTH
jgi:hypothetical protein